MFMKVEDIYPGYQKTLDYLSKIEKQIPEHQRSLVKVKEEQAETDTDVADVKIKKQVIERREQYKEEAERKYKEATDFYRRQNYVEAKIKFIQVEALYADFKDTRAYLAKIDQDISSQVQKGDDKAIRGLEVAWQESNVQ